MLAKEKQTENSYDLNELMNLRSSERSENLKLSAFLKMGSKKKLT